MALMLSSAGIRLGRAAGGSVLRSIRFNRSTSTSSSAAAPSATAGGAPTQPKVVPSVSELTSSVSSFASDFEGSLVGHLQARLLIEAVSNDDLFELTKPSSDKKFKLYCGADPTAVSLHLGNLLPLMVLLHFVIRGHDVVGLVGGATGEVGDPSGRTTERDQMKNLERLSNVDNIQLQMRNFFENGVKYAKSRNLPLSSVGVIQSENNASWWSSVKMLDFLATYGRHIRVSSMLARDSILSRLSSQGGLGFNEFTYQILQAFDFWHLFKHHNVNMQVGGNDQWGNITAGIDLISRLQRNETSDSSAAAASSSYGVTVPLLTTPSGEKFGKSAGNAVFISSELTSPFQLYQYFINAPDDMLDKLLRIFTLLPVKVIEQDILPRHNEDAGLRIGQRILAREVVDLIHGVGTGEEMAYITSFLFPTPDQSFHDISADVLLEKFSRSGILIKLDIKEHSDAEGDIKMSSLLSAVLNKSKSETKKLIKAGGIYLGIDREKFIDPEDVVLFDAENHLIDGKMLLVRSGKQNYFVVEVSKY